MQHALKHSKFLCCLNMYNEYLGIFSYMCLHIQTQVINSLSPLYQGCTKFQKMWEPPENSVHQKVDMRQVPYRGPTNIRHHHKKFSHSGYLAPKDLYVLFVHLPRTFVLMCRFHCMKNNVSI